MGRWVTVASFSSDAWTTLSDAALLDRSVEVIAEAASAGADILAFPEAWPQLARRRAGMSFSEIAEEAPGPHTQPILAACRERSIAAVWPLIERRSDGLFNTALSIGPDGRLLCRRDKTYLTDKELDGGLRHGRVFEVAELDWGRAASAICFDANFPDVWDRLARDGAEVVFFPSMFQAPRHLAFWALEHGYYILSALTKAGAGALIGQCGEMLAEADGRDLLIRRVNLNRRVVHMDTNLIHVPRITAKYGDAVRIERYDEESRMAIEVREGDLSVDDIIAEFGIERLADYRERMHRRRMGK